MKAVKEASKSLLSIIRIYRHSNHITWEVDGSKTPRKMTEHDFDEEHRALEEKQTISLKNRRTDEWRGAFWKQLSALRRKLAKVNEKHATLLVKAWKKNATFNNYKRRFEAKQVSEDYAGYYQGVREVLKHKTDLPGVVNSVAERQSVWMNNN